MGPEQHRVAAIACCSVAAKATQTALFTPSPQAHAAQALLSDESLDVRRAAAEHLLFSVRSFTAVPPEVVVRVCEEQDSEIVSSLLSFLGSVNDPASIAPVVCARFLSDTRSGIAVDAAAALGEVTVRSSVPFVPMTVLASTTLMRDDPRVRVFVGTKHGQGNEEQEVQELVARCLRIPERDQRNDLMKFSQPINGVWRDEQLNAVLVGLCSPGASVSTLSLRLITAYADLLSFGQLAKVWTGLGFVMNRYELASPETQFEYFNAVRTVEMPAELAPLVETFKCQGRSMEGMARDFTAVCLARDGYLAEAVARTEEMLWSETPSLSGGAASNLVILAGLDATHPNAGWRMVRMCLDAAIDRAGDGKDVVLEFLRAFSLLDSCQAQVLNYCADTIAKKSSPDALIITARVLGCIPWESSERQAEAGELLQVLANSHFSRVALAARRILTLGMEVNDTGG